MMSQGEVIGSKQSTNVSYAPLQFRWPLGSYRHRKKQIRDHVTPHH